MLTSSHTARRSAGIDFKDSWRLWRGLVHESDADFELLSTCCCGATAAEAAPTSTVEAKTLITTRSVYEESEKRLRESV